MAGSIPVSPTADALAPREAKPRHVTPGREAWRRFRRHRMAAISLVILTVLSILVIFGSLIWRIPIDEIDFTARLQSPSWTHPFGTDDLGQDLLARILYGGRISLAVGFAAMAVAVIVGVVIGAIAGISRGSVDAVLMWITDLFLSLPQLPLLLLIIYLFRDLLKGMFGVEGGTFILIVAVIGGFRWMPVARLVRAQFLSLREKEFVEAARALGASTTRQVVRHILPNSLGPVIVAVIGGFRWMPVARLVRAQFLSLREKEFVEAARALGASTSRQVVRHILPNSLGPVIVAGTIDVAAAIIAESTLSFLGLGFPPDTPTWGRLLFDAKDYLDIAPHWALFAGGMIFITVLTINFIGDGLRDALDPRKVL